MDEFVPKSLDEIDSLFFESERNVNSGREEPAQSSIPVSAPPAPAEKKKPEVTAPAITPAAKAPSQGRESLLPKQMLYKAAPMQAPVVTQSENSAFVMPKDYAVYGKSSMQINTPPKKEEPEVPEKKSKNKNKSKKKSGHTALTCVLSVMLVLSVVISAVCAALALCCNNSARKLFGYYVCSVEENTKNPVLSKGDIVFVTPVKPENIKEKMIVAGIDKEAKCYQYGIASKFSVSEGNTDLVTIRKVNEKGIVISSTVPVATILGAADNYLPYLGYAVSAINHYTVICAVCAAAVIFILTAAVIIVNSTYKKGKKDD